MSVSFLVVNVVWIYYPSKRSSPIEDAYFCILRSAEIQSESTLSGGLNTFLHIYAISDADENLFSYDGFNNKLTLMYRLLCSTSQSIARKAPFFPDGLQSMFILIACLFKIIFKLWFVSARVHSPQALWIDEMYVFQVPFHLCCIHMFPAALEDVHPWQEQSFDAADISHVQCK
jgi:hypothetical protein